MNPEKTNKNPLTGHYSFLWKVCLIYGICYLLFAYSNADGIGSGIFALISVVVILSVIYQIKKDDTLPHVPKITPMPVFYLVMAVIISFANCLTDNLFFLIFNHIGSFLLFTIGCIKLFYNDKDWNFSKYGANMVIYWCQILAAIPMPFQDFSSHRTEAKENPKKLHPTVKYVIIGILCGLPILFITTALLVSADSIFANMLDTVFNINALKTFLNHISNNLFEYCFALPICFFIYFLMMYLVMGALAKGGLKEDIKEPRRFQSVIGITMFAMIDVVYILFTAIQFIFLFSGFPTELYTSYAEYAREGFFQLLFVALINFIFVLFSNRHFQKNIALKITMTVTCLCTFVMIVSSAYRMLLYIHEYHLTFLRVFVLWFLLMLTFLMAGCTLSIYLEKWNSFRYSLFVLTIFYTGFALSNVDEKIAQYNVAQFEKALDRGEEVYLSNYLPDGYDYSLCYAAPLSDLLETRQKQLSDSNRQRIESYFGNIYDLFFRYEHTDSLWSVDYVLNTDAYIYDEEKQESIFTWKHFNYIEAKSYPIIKTNYNVKNWDPHKSIRN